MKIFLLLCLLLSVQIPLSSACFGPKLFIGVAPGLEAEMRYHLVAIYLHEKTGIDSTQVEIKAGQTAIEAIKNNEIDLGFSTQAVSDPLSVLQLDDGMHLYSGNRPLDDLQFSTVGRAFARLQKRINTGSLETVRRAIQSGTLPAAAVREFMLTKGWI